MRIRPTGVLALLIAVSPLRAVDALWNYTVEVTAAVQASPPQIVLSWPQDSSGTPASYTVFRKDPAASTWGSPLAVLSGSATTFADSAVVAGTAYEYQVVKDFTQAQGYSGYGYIEAGIDVPLADHRGTVILIVDNTFTAGLSADLQQLQQDLVGDGWSVIRHDVGRGDPVASVKNLILADYNAAPSEVKALFLFGHVPVPYSGLINPDGHPDHVGAWPADVYYGDMTGVWTDSTVNSVNTADTDPADAARISNVPGDGKFDQSTIPGLVRLEIGRVDLANMPGDLQYNANPSFPGEQALLQQYLRKDHNFRFTVLNPRRRALIGDYLGAKEGIAPGASAYRSFAPLVGSGASGIVSLNVIYNDAQGYWLPTLKTDDYLLAYGGGAGSYSTISGIGLDPPYDSASTTDLVGADVRAVFVMSFGSWFGDWDNQDNVLRSILALPTYGLASMYTGCPHWFIHPLGLGETIGYCARLTQNNTNPGLYQNQVNLSANGVHIALMGDPTLRLTPVAPPSALSGSVGSGGQLALAWTASTDPLVYGYHVYRSPSAAGPYVRLTTAPTASAAFVDAAPLSGATYMVRSVKRETTPSGSFENASQGIFYTAPAAIPTVPAPPSARLVNLSVLSQAGGVGQTLDVGFVIDGSASSGPMPVLVRATGPALQAYGVTGAMADPALTLYHGAAVAGFDDNWGTNAAQVTAADSAVGAFALSDPASADAALTASLLPGAYTAEVTGATPGKALAEVYDATAPATVVAGGRRLTNVSAMTGVGPGPNLLTLGFSISGTGSEQVLIRGIGPALAGYGVAGVLARPQLTLLTADGRVLQTNAGWGGGSSLAAVFAQVGAFALDPASADSALLATLPAGGYSVEISSPDGTSGVALGEVYEVK